MATKDKVIGFPIMESADLIKTSSTLNSQFDRIVGNAPTPTKPAAVMRTLSVPLHLKI